MHLNHVFTCPYRLWGSLIGGAAINMNGSSFQGYPSDAEGIHKFRLIMSINRIGGPSLTVHTSHGDHHFVVKDHTVVAQLLYSAYSHSNQVHSTCIEERKDVFAVFSSICNFTFNLNTSALVFPVHVQFTPVHLCSYSGSSRRIKSIGLQIALPRSCTMRYYNASYVQRRALLSALECLVVGSPVYTYSINVPQFALKQL